MTIPNHGNSRREHERIEVSLPVRHDAVEGVTKNVSIGGVYFEMDSLIEPGSEICLEIDMESPLGRLKMKCVGHVVRTEQHGARTGVAIRMKDARLDRAA